MRVTPCMIPIVHPFSITEKIKPTTRITDSDVVVLYGTAKHW
jgi:hypothetical protein